MSVLFFVIMMLLLLSPRVAAAQASSAPVSQAQIDQAALIAAQAEARYYAALGMKCQQDAVRREAQWKAYFAKYIGKVEAVKP